MTKMTGKGGGAETWECLVDRGAEELARSRLLSHLGHFTGQGLELAKAGPGPLPAPPHCSLCPFPSSTVPTPSV